VKKGQWSKETPNFARGTEIKRRGKYMKDTGDKIKATELGTINRKEVIHWRKRVQQIERLMYI